MTLRSASAGRLRGSLFVDYELDGKGRSLAMKSSVERFDSQRMRAERIAEADFAELNRMNQDARVMATLGGIRTEEQTRDFLRASIEHWERHGFGIWIFRERQQGNFVGRAGLRHVTIEDTPEVELLYAAMAEFWRKGLGAEMARSVLEVGARELALRDVIAFTLPNNRASRGVMEKVGFQYERDITWASLPHVLYRRRIADLK